MPVSLVSTTNVPTPAAGGPSTSPSAGTSVPASLTKEKKKKQHLTTTTDPLLAELQDLNFSAVGKKLNQVARRLDDDYKVRTPQNLPAVAYYTPFTAQTQCYDGNSAEGLRRETGWAAVRTSSFTIA